MATMNMSLSDALKSFVDDQVGASDFRRSSEFVRELIRKEQDRQHLRGLLLGGPASPSAVTANAGYFDGLRGRVRETVRR